MRSIFPACSRFRPALTSRVMSACEASGRWPRWRSRLSAPQRWRLTQLPWARRPRRCSALDYFVPALGKGAEILDGSREEVIDKVIELVKAKGGLK